MPDHVLRPPLQVLRGSARSGKTTRLLSRFLEKNGKALLIVASPEHAEYLIQSAANLTGAPAADFSPRILSFRSFIERLRDQIPDSKRVIGQTFQKLIITELIPQTLRPEDFFGAMIDSPGFASALTERIREWKFACLTPDALQQGLALVPNAEEAFNRKTAELIRLFRAYEQFLRRHELSDNEDALQQVSAFLEQNPTPLPFDADCVLIDGFFRFNPAQRRLLHALSVRGTLLNLPPVEVTITLPADPERPFLFAASDRTYATLCEEFAVNEQFLAAQSEGVPESLSVLERLLFAPQAEPLEPTAAPEIVIHDAPTPYVEVEMAARTLRRLHEEQNIPYHEMGIVLRTMGDYAPILAAVFERFEVPFGLDGPETVAKNPLIQAVCHLLAIVRHGWQRDDVLAFLKSSYTLPDKIAVDTLRRRACKNAVRNGRDAWLKLCAELPQEPGTPSALLHTLAGWEARLFAPGLHPFEFAQIIEEAFAEFGLNERVQEGELRRIACDEAARKAANDVMHTMAEMARLSGKTAPSFAQFHEQLIAAWETTRSVASLSGEMVRVYEPHDTRQCSLRVAIVMGMMERVFPRRVVEDPFFRDEERRVLHEFGGIALEEMRNRADDERLFFYFAVTAASERLYLSYPRSSDESDTLPSFYLDEVRAVVTPTTVSRTLADVAPRADEILNDADRLLSGCAALFDPIGNDAASVETAKSLLEQCLASDSVNVRAVLDSRLLPHLPKLHSAELRRDFGHGKRAYSVSELETYNRCPFQYLLRHVLKIQPDAGNAHAAQGTLLHAVLRRWFRKQKQDNALPATADAMQTGLCEILDEVMATERLDLNASQKRMTHRILSDSLQGFAKREERYHALFDMEPGHFELAFGLACDGNLAGEDHEEVFGGELTNEPGNWHDTASVQEPLEICAKDGGAPVAICGVIDRVDYMTEGSRAMVMDYKLGKPPEYAAILRGDSLQMPIYMMAMERLFASDPAAACYDSMTERGRPRLFRAQAVSIKRFAPVAGLENGETVKPLNHSQYTEIMTAAEFAVIRAARGIEQGRIEATPGDHCRTCTYGDICRTTLTGGHDGEPISI